MSTGAFVRVRRQDKYQSIEIDSMTNDELHEWFSFRNAEEARYWAIFLASWIRDNITESDNYGKSQTEG